MEYYGNNDWRDYHLAHYGRKGMKKGKHLPGTDWWKDITGLKYKDEYKRQDAIQKQEEKLADAAWARSTQAYNPGRTDKDYVRGLKAEEESHQHRRNAEEAFTKKLEAKKNYEKNNLKQKVKDASTRLKNAWATNVTGEAYKRGVNENMKNARLYQRHSDDVTREVVRRNNAFENERNAKIRADKQVNKVSQKQAEKNFNREYANRETHLKYNGDGENNAFRIKSAKQSAARARSYVKTANALQKSYYNKSLKGKAENFLKKRFKKKRYYDRSDLG